MVLTMRHICCCILIWQVFTTEKNNLDILKKPFSLQSEIIFRYPTNFWISCSFMKRKMSSIKIVRVPIQEKRGVNFSTFCFHSLHASPGNWLNIDQNLVSNTVLILVLIRKYPTAEDMLSINNMCDWMLFL